MATLLIKQPYPSTTGQTAAVLVRVEPDVASDGRRGEHELRASDILAKPALLGQYKPNVWVVGGGR